MMTMVMTEMTEMMMRTMMMPGGGSGLLHLCHCLHSLPYILYIAPGLDISLFCVLIIMIILILINNLNNIFAVPVKEWDWRDFTWVFWFVQFYLRFVLALSGALYVMMWHNRFGNQFNWFSLSPMPQCHNIRSRLLQKQLRAIRTIAVYRSHKPTTVHQIKSSQVHQEDKERQMGGVGFFCDCVITYLRDWAFCPKNFSDPP